MFKRTSTLAAAAVTAALLAVAPQAAQAMTIRVGDPQLIAKMAVSVPVIVSCSPFDPEFVFTGSGVSVSVQQAAGKDIAYGYGSAGFMSTDAPFTCDGTEQTVELTAMANPAGAPFHGGKAVVGATASASAGVPCWPGSTTCFTNYVSQTASTGAVAAKL
jgi:hypothetical protein